MDVLSTDQFTWTGREGSAEASDLGFRAGALPRDMVVRSTKTQDGVRFEIHHQEVSEGDLLFTKYLGVSNGLFVSLTIFND